MRKLVASGSIDQNEAFDLERECMNAVINFDKGMFSKESTLKCLLRYERLFNPTKTRVDAIKKVLTDQPWKTCKCDICTDIGIHVLLKRGAARNRRRGFHNLYIAYERLKQELKNIQ
jgi:hypothetical protein